MRIIAGIVTYNPDISILRRNISSVLQQVNEVVVIDNHSSNAALIRDLANSFKVVLIENIENNGIAKALNQICYYAERYSFDWVLTLDQDSIIPDILVKEYKKYLRLDKVGMICCQFEDRNINVAHNNNFGKEYEFVPVSITSGSMISLLAWKKVGGFCEELFIDCVDNDICYSLSENGYRILRVNTVVMSHTIGQSNTVVFNGKEITVYGESPLRCYYIFRNSIYIAKHHWPTIKRFYPLGIISYLHSICRRIWIINKFEDNVREKNKMISKGLWHGVIGKYGKYQSK